MGLMRPTPVPYDALDWVKKPFAERARMVCEAWALQGYGTPVAIYLIHVLKIGLYVGAWIAFCGATPGLGAASGRSIRSIWSRLSGTGLDHATQKSAQSSISCRRFSNRSPRR